MRIAVVEYNPAWPAQYQAECQLLSHSLGDAMVAVHHIGSTAVPGLSAKPIIDILIEVTSLSVLDEHPEVMASIGYEYWGELGIAGRRYYPKGGDDRTHQVHAFVSGDPNVERHIAFRDYLRANPQVASEYGELKARVARECDQDIGRYCDGKNAYVKRIEAIALQARTAQQGG